MEIMMPCRHKIAQTADGREAAVATEVRWSGCVFALAAGLSAAALSLSPLPTASAAATVKVLYAGSLVNLMEHGVGPAFDKATGNQFQGYAGG